MYDADRNTEVHAALVCLHCIDRWSHFFVLVLGICDSRARRLSHATHGPVNTLTVACIYKQKVFSYFVVLSFCIVSFYWR
jgi:hypothetical protein